MRKIGTAASSDVSVTPCQLIESVFHRVLQIPSWRVSMAWRVLHWIRTFEQKLVPLYIALAHEKVRFGTKMHAVHAALRRIQRQGQIIR